MNPTSPKLTEQPIYLDYCATTPVDPRVLEVMMPFFSGKFGNASSRDHGFGWDANEAIEHARSKVADLVGGKTTDIIFTSCATESINLALKSAAFALRGKGNHIITTTVEHQAVLATCRYLEKNDFEVTSLPVNGEGQLNLQVLGDAIRPSTILLSVMHANNETGVIFPIAEIGRIARKRNVTFFTDVTQTAGKLAVDFPALGVDLAAFSSHKIYGPKGAGSLYIGDKNLKSRLTPLLHGGGQEAGLRSGTLNVPAIVGFGEACRIAANEMAADAEKCRLLRDLWEREITHHFSEVKINGGTASRLPHVSNISFPGTNARELIRRMGNAALATAAACSSGFSGTSHVLQAMGKDAAAIDGAIRMSCGRYLTEEEIRNAVECVSYL